MVPSAFRALLVAGALAAMPGVARAQLGEAPPPLQQVTSMMHGYALGMEAMGKGRAGEAVQYMRDAERFAPGNPALLVGLARAQIRANDLAGAMATLARLRPLGIARDPRESPTWEALRAQPGFAALGKALFEAARPVVRSDTAAIVADDWLVPESIALDPVDGTLYVGSMGKRMVVRAGRAGAQGVLVAEGRDGIGQVLGMRVEPGTRRLWIANWVPDTTLPRTAMGLSGRAQVDVVELPAGNLVRRITLPSQEMSHLLNDIAFGPDGSAYLTDSHGSRVWRVARGADAPELFFHGPAARFTYPNGITLAPDGRALLVAHMEGITRVDLATRKGRMLAVAPGHHAGQLDGMYACGRDLVGIQSLADDVRVVRLTLDATGTRVTGSRTLERRHPAARIPTTGALRGDTLLYVADARLDRLRQDGTVAPPTGPSPTVILALPLAPGCDR